MSLSIKPIVPIPALTRFSAAGHPRPPRPTIKILEDKIFSLLNFILSFFEFNFSKIKI